MNLELLNTILLGALLGETTFLTVRSLRAMREKARGAKIYIDTSTLMDGRVLGVAQSGIITDDIVILSSVLREMQLLADGPDSNKRARARAGLDVASTLERTVEVNAYVENDASGEGVDELLLTMAKKNRAAIMTNDFNLNKRATAEGVRVMNVNDLALAMRSEFQPGEKLTVKVTDRGNNRKQGVGYLPDGTMVVIENAREKVGQEVEIELVRYNQTPAGRMMFARAASTTGPKPSRNPRRSGRRSR